MTIVRFEAVGKEYGARWIVRNLSCQIGQGERWGVVGRNGEGKSTLLKLITGEESPSEGEIWLHPGLSLSVLQQQREDDPGRSLADAALEPFQPLLELERALEEDARFLESAPGDDPELDRRLRRYDRNLEEFRRRGGYEMRARAAATLEGLGFEGDPATRLLSSLSGGEFGRLRLAQALLASPDLLLLDEPTNHLDLRSMEWLESFLRSYPGTLIVVSHDRVFLEQVADHILHLEEGTAFAYPGGYERFLMQREERREQLRREFEKQQAYIARTEEFIRRNLAGQKTKQAQSRRTLLGRLERIDAPGAEERPMALRFDGARRSGASVLRLDRVVCGFGSTSLIHPFSAEITRGERVALIGPNGSGKSTLLKAIAGTWPPQSGTITQGAGVRIAYYRQDFSHFDPERSVHAQVAAAAPGIADQELRSHLGRFLFSGERAESRISDLSGGEKARVALAIATLQGANLLLLDEPTNHLDIVSREVLEAALEDFSGAILFISHDRALLSALATRIWALEGARPAQIRDLRGGFAEWRERAQLPAARSAAAPIPASASEKAGGRSADPGAAPLSKNELRRLRVRVAQLEEEIARAESALAEVEAELADPALYREGADPARIRARAADRDTLAAKIESLYAGWEAAGEEVALAGG